ncbi:MAG TPA: phosphomannomutase/phosphoglucomutase [Tepidisphaeraceae bacterium]|jgi:phosphomannomutase
MIEKIFKAYDVRSTYPAPLNEDAAWKVGHATGQFLKRGMETHFGGITVKNPNRVVVGRDMRPHSPALAKALSDGLRSVGFDVVDVGMIDTSFIYYAINELDAIGGIQTTASHNPIQYNGFKISGPKAKPIGSSTGLEDIKRIAMSLKTQATTGVMGKYEEQDLWAGYRKHVLSFLQLRRPLRIAVDASSGMAGKMVPAVFNGVRDLEIVPLNFEITGAFAHDPNPLVEANLEQLKNLMKEQKVDLGACFDGDADRCMFIDEKLQTIGCDILTAVMARDFLKMPQNKGSAIVYDLRSSKVVVDEITAAGGVAKRERVGHSFMKKTLAESGAVFGGELSGHFYFRDNFNADSGAIAFARLLSILSATRGTLSEVIDPFKKYSQSGELNFQVEDKDGKIRELANQYKDAKSDYLDGLTVDAGEWWFNVRKSNTEPLLRLNLEASSPAQLEAKLADLKKVLGEPAHGH